jgi:hypothetical protein
MAIYKGLEGAVRQMRGCVLLLFWGAVGLGEGDAKVLSLGSKRMWCAYRQCGVHR